MMPIIGKDWRPVLSINTVLLGLQVMTLATRLRNAYEVLTNLCLDYSLLVDLSRTRHRLRPQRWRSRAAASQPGAVQKGGAADTLWWKVLRRRLPAAPAAD